MFKGKSYLTCYLSHIGEDFSNDIPASAIPLEALQTQIFDKVVKLEHPRNVFGLEINEDVTRYCVDFVQMPNGKFAFPVYEKTPWYEDDEPWKSREGEMNLVGWCVRDDNPFSRFEKIN